MTRANFGGGAADFLAVIGAGNTLRPSPGTLTFWDAEEGGTQHTDLLLDGVPTSTIVVGSDGQVPTFQGPDGVGSMWADAGFGRVRLLSDKTGEELASDEFIATQVTTPASATATALSGLIAGRVPMVPVAAGIAGVVGDGATDDTAAIQAIIDGADAGSEIRFAPGEYAISSALTVSNLSGIVLDGSGHATLVMKSTGSAFSAFSPAGSVADVTIQGFTIAGSGVEVDGHSGFGNSSGVTIKNLRILNNTITDVIVGISLNADLSGTIDGALVQGNSIERVVGKDSGRGYGIHHASGDYTKVANVRIIGNTILDAGRHSIYQGKGRGVVIANNTIRDHRKTVSATESNTIRYAIAVSRSVDVSVVGNVVLNSYGGALGCGGTAGAAYSERVLITGNIFDGGLDSVQLVTIGSQGPSTEGTVSQVRFTGNMLVRQNSLGTCLTLHSGINVDITENTFDLTVSSSQQCIALAASEETVGTATYTDNLEISRNRFITRGTAAAYAVRLNKETSAYRLIARDNVHVQLSSTASPFWVISVGVSNPNITISRNSIGGLTMTADLVPDRVLARAYTQTYSTATRSHANLTSLAVATTAATNTSPFGFTTQAQADAIVAAINALRTDLTNVKGVLNAVIDDLGA